MANVNTTVERVYTATPPGSNGLKMGYIKGVTKAAQNDTVTITNVNAIVLVTGLCTDAAGAAETRTFTSNVITCTSATTGTVSGTIYYR